MIPGFEPTGNPRLRLSLPALDLYRDPALAAMGDGVDIASRPLLMASAARASGNNRPAARNRRTCFSAHRSGLPFSGNRLGPALRRSHCCRGSSFDAVLGFRRAWCRFVSRHRRCVSDSPVVGRSYSGRCRASSRLDRGQYPFRRCFRSLSETSRRLSLSSRKPPSLRRVSSSFRSPLCPAGPKQRKHSGTNRSIAAASAAKYSPSVRGYRPRPEPKETTGKD